MNNLKKLWRLCFFFVLLFSFQQCKLYKNPEDTKELSKKSVSSSFDIPEYWESKQDTVEVSENWYKSFKDNDLNKLIEEAVDTTNMNIIYQLALIEESQARTRLSKSAKKVRVGYGGNYSGSSNTKGTNDYGFTASAGISWEADLWGKIETGLLAADENLQADIYNYSYTRQSIAGSVSKLYFEIGTVNQILKIGDNFLSLNDSLVRILKVRESVGIIDMEDVHLTNAQISTIKNIIERYKNTLQINTRNLEAVVGRYPSNELKVNWEPSKLETVETISNPIDLINRRPDIKRNESIVRSQFYLNEQARLAKYPSLVLSANLGVSTIGALVFGTGGSLFGPIFNGGALDSKIEIATAIQKQALMSYGLNILDAFNEVEIAMNSEQYLIEQEKYLKAAIDETKSAYEIILKQFQVGRIDMFDVLQIQLQWLLKELDLVNVKGEIYRQRVQLYLALGGNITN